MKSALVPTLAENCIGRFRGERLRALLDAAADVAKGSQNPRLQLLAREVLNSARSRGLAAL